MDVVAQQCVIKARGDQGRLDHALVTAAGDWGIGGGAAGDLDDVGDLGPRRIVRLWDSGDRWLPGQLLSALAHGGTSTSSYTHALVVLAAYAAVLAAGTLVLFQQRDV